MVAAGFLSRYLNGPERGQPTVRIGVMWARCFLVSDNDVVDQILTVLFSTSMLVGGVVAFILDNTIPGKL